MKSSGRIFITGIGGMLERALVRKFKSEGFDLTLREGSYIRKVKPDYVFLTSVKSGGIQANIDHPAEFLYDNLENQNNVINAALKSNVKRLFFIAASCAYPKDCPQPIKEEYLLTGPLEPTNEAYAVAKIAGIKLCQACNHQYRTRYISLVPPNLYGPGDDFSPDSSHVIPALIRKMDEAKVRGDRTVKVWGSGRPERDFMYIDDFVDACFFLMDREGLPEIMNVGTGMGVSISRLAESIKKIVGFKGEIVFDETKPDGMPKKVLDPERLISLGWKPPKDPLTGLDETYKWYKKEMTKR